MRQITGYQIVWKFSGNSTGIVHYNSYYEAARAVSEGAEEIFTDEELWCGEADADTAAAIADYYNEYAIAAVY